MAKLLDQGKPPRVVEMGRLALARFWRRFPVGTVHLAVVDPGVGTERAALAHHLGGRTAAEHRHVAWCEQAPQARAVMARHGR